MIKLFSRVCLLVAILCIEYLAFTPRHIEVVAKSWDKANHVLAFLVLYILLWLSLSSLHVRGRIAILVFYGLHIEIVQSFLPYRYFSLLDMVANMVGIGLGVLVCGVFEKYMDKN